MGKIYTFKDANGVEVKIDSAEHTVQDAQIQHAVQTNVLDSAGGVFLELQLQALKAKSYDVKYPELNARQIFSVDSTAGEFADTVAYQTLDQRGMTEWMNDGANDIPLSSVTISKQFTPIYEAKTGIAYSVTDLGQAQMVGRDLPSQQMMASVRSTRQFENSAVFNGDASKNMKGFFSAGNGVPRETGLTGGWDAALASGSLKTIIADMATLIGNVSSNSKGVFQARTVYVPLSFYNKARAVPRSEQSDMTALKFIEENLSVQIVGIPECEAYYAVGGKAMAFAGDFSIENAWIEEPMPLKWLAPVITAFGVEVGGMVRMGGLVIPYPIAFNIAADVL